MHSLTKRQKLEIFQQFEIKAILPFDHQNNFTLENGYITKLDEKKHISTIMQELSQKLPLPEKLQQLKRVRNNDIFICRVKDLAQYETITEYLRRFQVSEHVIEIVCNNIEIAQVPSQPTKLRFQYEKLRQYWPLKFHPNKYLESLNDGSNFTAQQIAFHNNIANLLIKISKELEEQCPVGICIDPRSGSIVAIASSRININPMMHCAMLLIDNVARTQNGGAWSKQISTEYLNDNNMNSKKNLAGIEKRYYEYLKYDLKTEIQFGAERARDYKNEDRVVEENLNTNEMLDNLARYGPYLCTGYDIYLKQEPCLMCAMALVHSRARRIFFLQNRVENGALLSCYKLHSVKELNHHYEVFQCIELKNSEIHR